MTVTEGEAGEHLTLGRAQGSTRYLLGGKVLSGGDVLQLCCSGGWLTGRFEWDRNEASPPMFFFSIELGGGRVEQQSIALPEGALLRRL